MISNINETRHEDAAKTQRTSIADISMVGEELSDEQLEFVSGARAETNRSSYTEWVGGRTDTDKPF